MTNKNDRQYAEQNDRQKAASAVERVRVSNQRFARDAARRSATGRPRDLGMGSWKRETYTLHRLEARLKAQAFLKKYPKAAYWSEVESWRVLPGDVIEFTMRRLPSAD